MKMNEQIRENRKKIGLTQEQIANYLGVSTPAVNKWEKGATYPDITLLPALARLLKIDLNTLFFFHEELTELEIKMFMQELIETSQNGDLDIAFELAADKIREYPRCDSLLYSVANVLDSSLILSTMNTNQKEKYEGQILAWYERAAGSQEESIKNAAIYMLAGKYIKSTDYDKASKLIEQIPEKTTDKAFFQVDIFMHQEKIDEAGALLAGKLVQDLNKIQMYLYKLIDVELKADKQEEAKQIAETAQSMVPLFGLWHYGALVPHLQIALHQKDVSKSIKQLKAILEAAHTPWDMNTSPLFYRIAQNTFTDMGKYFIPALKSEFESSIEYDFLRENSEFQKLIEMCHEE